MATEQVLKVLSGGDAVVFVAELANRLTVLARGAYRGVENTDLEKLVAANEAMHVATAKLLALVVGSDRYADAAFLEAIEERAGEELGSGLTRAIAESLKAVDRHNAKSA